MKFLLALIILIFSTQSIFAQDDIGYLSYLHELGNKQTVTFEDAVKIFVMITDQESSDFEKNYSVLKKLNIISAAYKKDNPLKRGTIALMVAKYLDLKDIFLYRLLKIERYAYKACAAANIMDSNQSEYDLITGEELIEIMSTVEKMKRGDK